MAAHTSTPKPLTIGRPAALADVSANAVRFYEREGSGVGWIRDESNGAPVRVDMPALLVRQTGNHADRRLSVFLRVRELQDRAATASGRLLRLLLLRIGEVPAGASGSSLLRLMSNAPRRARQSRCHTDDGFDFDIANHRCTGRVQATPKWQRAAAVRSAHDPAANGANGRDVA